MTEKSVFEIVGCQRQLFLDQHGVERIENLYQTMHQPSKKGAVIRPDVMSGNPVYQIRSAPMWDEEEDLFKLVLCSPYIAYYQSSDGLHWTLSDHSSNHTPEPMLQAKYTVRDPKDADRSCRFKGLATLPNGLQPLASHDAAHWHKLDVPVISTHDETNISYDSIKDQFIVTGRCSELYYDPSAVQGGYSCRGTQYGRSVFMYTSQDFRTWSNPGKLIFHADELDQSMGRHIIDERFSDPTLEQPIYNTPIIYKVDVYNMGVFRYESRYLGMPAMYYKTGQVKGDWPGFDAWDIEPKALDIYRRDGDWAGFHHLQLASSRDLKHWKRLGDRQPFIAPSHVNSGAYDLATIMPPSSPIVRGDELWFYYTGSKKYGGPNPAKGVDRDQGAICLAVLRRDGFISLDAGEHRGTVTTQPFHLRGTTLFVNIDASNGTFIVEVIDDGGNVIAASTTLNADLPQGEVLWIKGSLSTLQGTSIRLRFTLKNSSFYSYWIEK